ncbi:MAG: TIGR02186 family protein [Nitrospirae bacterium]|nr:TIGR02186 family protein [Nitrospirota bacterium]
MTARFFTTLLMFAACALCINHAEASLSVSVDKKLIPINAFYKGNVLTISGTVERGKDVVVKITSPQDSESFMIKAKFFHLFWMNKDKVDVSKVNSVYMLYSSGDMDGLLSSDEKNKYLLGLKAIENNVEISGGSDKDMLFKEFIKVKEEGKLYSVTGNKVVMMPAKDNNNSFWLSVNMPYQVPIGSYNIDVYAVGNHMVQEAVSSEVTIEPVGMVLKISDMAMAHGGIYGMFAILIALFAGYTVTPVIALSKKILIMAITLPKSVVGTHGVR